VGWLLSRFVGRLVDFLLLTIITELLKIGAGAVSKETSVSLSESDRFTDVLAAASTGTQSAWIGRERRRGRCFVSRYMIVEVKDCSEL